jgi:ATP-binding protein involved in chromosome partitioning
MQITKHQIIESLKKVTFPGSKSDIVSQEKIKNIDISEANVSVVIFTTKEESKYHTALADTIRHAIQKQLESKIDIIVTYDTPAVKPLDGGIGKVKNIIAIASGKGGVGKSTITANLAVTLAQKGYKVGVIDADISGPSIPKMFGIERNLPNSTIINEKQFMIPIERFGIKILSIGLFVKPEESLAWRGPMASSALRQLITEADWGELDILLFDTPPGTSDIHLTIVQTLPLTGVVIVTTPQDVAIIDAVRGIDLFRKGAVSVPILGLIENMSWFTPAELPNNKYYIFGKSGGEKLAADNDIPLLGQVPIVQKIREGGDNGEPVSIHENSLLQTIFSEITNKLIVSLKERNDNLPETHQIQMKH